MIFSGLDPVMKLIEMVELNDHPWFLGCQFHPEFKSKPFMPHPLFIGFVKATLEYQLTQRTPRKAMKAAGKSKGFKPRLMREATA